MQDLAFKNSEIPTTSTDVRWTPVGELIGEYANVGLSPSTPCRLHIKREANGNVKRVLVKVDETFMPDAGTTIYPLQPYVNSCHIVTAYDSRYATLEQLKQTMFTLLTTLLWAPGSGAQPSVVERILRGEN